MLTFAVNQNQYDLYSSEDLERFYFQYQTEALPHGESLQSFCAKHNVPYNIFQKWFKDTRKRVVEVRVDGAVMLNVIGLNHFYYVRDFTDMRCKHSRVLSIVIL